MSSGVEWAVHCCVVLSLAEHPVPTARLAQLHDVSTSYLAKQLQALSGAKIIRPAQGGSGGYLLDRPAEQITVLDIVEAIDGPGPTFICTEIRQRGPLAATADQCNKPCAITRAMATAEQAWREALRASSIADLASQVNTDYDSDILGPVSQFIAQRG